MSKSCVYAAKFSNTGLAYFYSIPIRRLPRVIRQISDVAKSMRGGR